MIYRDKILSALASCESEFAFYESDLKAQVASYNQTLEMVSAMNSEALLAKLELANAPGAIPTTEFFDRQAFIIPFTEEWTNREQAREWAYQTLLNRTTFAADGSQIMPTKDFSIPIAAVQVGWFENLHTITGDYVKDAAFEILPPEKILVRSKGDTEASEQVVHQRRYAMEIAAIKNFLRTSAQRGFDKQRPPVVFFDSLLVISFADILPAAQRDFYVGEILALLNAAKETGIPLVGYVDTSVARDLVNMLRELEPELSDSPKLQDAALLAPRMQWGDRTPLFICARQGILEAYGDEWRRNVAFCYVKTTGDAPPSRIDVPLWVYEAGLLEYVVDTVRGEVIVGNGYPYVIEAADQTAVIGTQDREAFYALFQEFATRKGFDLRIARKAISKAHRR
ncbi:MAG: DNA double-strand break repair nuclease NurA [Acidobacteria bacterium]|nr:DNA double-strand break repair nuclease NurA [Acidobacteriota bacterium]